jgi:hypothetical protein
MFVLKPIHFINEEVNVLYEHEPIYKRTPTPPDGFVWKNERFNIKEILLEWKDFDRRGKNAHNMRPTNLLKAAKRGSRAVGRFYFRIMTDNDRIFQIYFDRSNWDSETQTGSWILHSEYAYQLNLPND